MNSSSYFFAKKQCYSLSQSNRGKRSRSRSAEMGGYGPGPGYGRQPHGMNHGVHHHRNDGRGNGQFFGGGPAPPPQPPNDRGGRRRGRRDETVPGASILVRNISTQVTSADLQAAFSRIGEIKDVYIPIDYHSKEPKGFAFIEYGTQEQARNAKEEMHRFQIKGRELEVVFAQEKRKTPGEMRIRTDSPDNRGEVGLERSSSFERHRQREDDRRRGR